MESYYVSLTDIGESRLEKEDINVDNLKDNEAIIKADYSMISSGTELSRAFALKKGFKYPVRPGYCMVGYVLKCGQALDLVEGDKVFVNAPHASLVRASHDKSDVQGPKIMKLPEDIDEVSATAINLFLVAIQGVNLTSVKLGDVVGVFGLGNIGIITALMYQNMGCKVIGLDPVENRCNLARKMGLKYVVSSKEQKEEIMKLTDNLGLDIGVDVTGLSMVINNVLDCTRKYGQVLLLGSPRQSYEADLTGVFSLIHMKNLKVIGGFNSTTPFEGVCGSNDSMARNFKVCVDLIRNKVIDVRALISEIISPKDCQRAYYDLMYNKDRVNCIVYDFKKL